MGNIEDKSWRYALLKQLVKIPFLITHRHFTVNGLANVPIDKPVIFAPNHQNALLDPLAIIFSGHFQPVFLARADIFKNKIVARILNFLKILPVYRIRDGKDNLDNNTGVFDAAVRILQHNKMLCLFPEASHIGMKSMLPHKKAIPRIVFIAAEKTDYHIDILIVPVGINYTSYYGFRRSVTINFGKPISAKQYYITFQNEGETKAANAMRNAIFNAVKQLVVHVPSKEDYPLYEQAFEMAAAGVFKTPHTRSVDFVAREQWLTEIISDEITRQPENKNALVDAANRYKILKTKLNITEQTLKQGRVSFVEMVSFVFAFVVTFPISLWGATANGLVFYLTRYPYRKYIKDQQFYSSFSFVMSLVIYPLWYLAAYFAVNFFISNRTLALFLLLVSVPSGIWAWKMAQKIRSLRRRIVYNGLIHKNNPYATEVNRLHNKLLSFFGRCINQKTE